MCLPNMGIPRGMREQGNTNNFMNKKDTFPKSQKDAMYTDKTAACEG